MRIRLRMSWLLAACLCLPLLSRAQSPKSNYVVSVRELSIPPKAFHAFQKGIELLAKKRCSAKLAAISTRHRGICELLRGLLQDGSGGPEIVAHRGRRAGLSEIHCSKRRTVRASAACSGCGPQLPTRICRGRGRHPHGFGFGPNLLDGSLFPGLGVVRFEPPGRGGEKCPRSASADDRFRAGSTPAR